jgi:hypothetical protein
MRPGDKWSLTIPSELAYGDRGSPPKIPGGSVLNFELELISISEPSPFTILGFDLTDPQTLIIAAIVLFYLYRNFFAGGGGGPKGDSLSLTDVSSSEHPIVFFESAPHRPHAPHATRPTGHTPRPSSTRPSSTPLLPPSHTPSPIKRR